MNIPVGRHARSAADDGESARGPGVVLSVPFCNSSGPNDAEPLDRPHRPHYYCAL